MFSIRRNHPYRGVITLCKTNPGAFVSTTMTVSQAEFLEVVSNFVGQISPVKNGKTEAPAIADKPEPSSTGGKMKLRKVHATA